MNHSPLRCVALCYLGCAVIVPALAATADYNPQIDPAAFTAKIDNPFFSLPKGRKLTYEGKTAEGTEHIEIAISGETRKIMGVETLVYSDTEYLNGQLKEQTRDYVAQDKDGNVWYFGEDVDNYENGKLVDHEGQWIAGVDGALPGIWLRAKHSPGESYRMEYYKGEAEDFAKIEAVGETVKVPAGTFENCTKIYEWTPLDPDSTGHKYYCAGIGALALEVERDGSRIELIKVEDGG